MFVFNIILHMRIQIYISYFILAICLSTCFSGIPVKQEQQADQFIESIYQQLSHDKTQPMSKRLEQISRVFLSKPYFLGALGEGAMGQFDQYPLYRVDVFDCLTFVETVLALASSNNLAAFKQTINQIRYQNDATSFITRNHFTDLDWNLHNQQQGFLRDITKNIQDKSNHQTYQLAQAMIDKPSWYQHLPISRIRIENATAELKNQRLAELRKLGQTLPSEVAMIPYQPLSELFDSTGKANEQLFRQIPDGAIIEIVRPNWDLTKTIGTHLNVSHLGFAFWRNGTLWFRNASMLKGQVVDQSLIDYLRDARQSPTIKGINVQEVLPLKQHSIKQ